MSALFSSSDTIDTGASSTNTLVLLNFTTSGQNRQLDVATSVFNTSTTNLSVTVTRPGDTITHQRSDDNPEGSRNARGSLSISTTEPVTGPASITTVLGASKQYWGFVAAALTGVDQANRIENLALNPTGQSSVGSMNVNSAVDDLVCSFIASLEGTPPTAPTGGTEVLRDSWLLAGGSIDHAGLFATAPGSSSVALDWNGSPFRFVHYGWNHPAAVEDSAPDQVTGLEVSAYSAEKFKLSWSEPAGNPTGYKIEVSDNDADWDVHTANTGSTATVVHPGGYAPDTTKFWRVSAINDEGTGTASASASATLPDVPDQDSLALLDFSTPFFQSLPPYGAGSWPDADIQDLLGLPIAPLLTENQVPIADAGADQNVGIGDLVQLDGSGSSDPDDDPLSYSWSISSAPVGSSVSIDNPGLVDPTFSPDLTGVYTIRLVVSDGQSNSAPDFMTITVAVVPIANAGPDQIVRVGDLVQLDGSGSIAATTYAWTMISLPAGSLAVLSDDEISNPTFLADIPGTYVLGLVVDGETENDDVVDITVQTIDAITPMYVAAHRPATVPGNRRKAGVPAATIELWKYPKDLYDVAVDWEEDDVLPAGATAMTTLTVVVKNAGGDDVTETLVASSGVDGFVSWAQLQAGTAGQVYDVILTQVFNNGQSLDRYVKVQVRNPRSYIVHTPYKYPADKYPIPVEWAGRRPRGNPALSTLITKAYTEIDGDETSTYIAGSFVTGTIGAGYILGGSGGESRLLEFAQEFANGRKFHEYAMLTVEVPPA